MKDLADATLCCIIDRKPIPEERAVRASNTCSRECATKLKKIRRARADRRKCRTCGRPSTPEERARFKRWRAAEGDGPKKRGRPAKASPSEWFCDSCQMASQTKYCGRCGSTGEAR